MADLVKRHPALSLFLLAFALGTAPIILVVLGLAPSGVTQLGALSASTAGIVLAAVEGGKPGTLELLRRALIWRVGIGWWVFVLLFPALLAVAAICLARLFDSGAPGLPPIGSLPGLLPTMIALILFAGFGEEFGWRGFALPRVQVGNTAFVASLIIGGFHSLWHIPLFFIDGIGQHDVAQQIGFLPGFLGYSVLVLSGAVQSTWIFNNTRGSVLLVAVYHGVLNTWASTIDIAGGRLGAIYAYTALSAMVSVVIVVLFGSEHLSKTTRREEIAD